MEEKMGAWWLKSNEDIPNSRHSDKLVKQIITHKIVTIYIQNGNFLEG